MWTPQGEPSVGYETCELCKQRVLASRQTLSIAYYGLLQPHCSNAPNCNIISTDSRSICMRRPNIVSYLGIGEIIVEIPLAWDGLIEASRD